MNISKWLSLLIVFFCIACDKPLPTLEGIDLERWKADKNACNDTRAGMREAIDREKTKLLRLDQMQIVELLGRPDQNELYTRNQKFFFYFLEPAPTCPAATDSVSERLVIRFNAMGLAKEVMIE